MSGIAVHSRSNSPFTLVCDDRCPVVRRLSSVLSVWDRHGQFRTVGRAGIDEPAAELVNQLDSTPWSLLLIDNQGQRWSGPEAIPIILKNLPFGKLAAVLYILPGTMWLTRSLYLTVSRVSRSRRRYAC